MSNLEYVQRYAKAAFWESVVLLADNVTKGRTPQNEGFKKLELYVKVAKPIFEADSHA